MKTRVRWICVSSPLKLMTRKSRCHEFENGGGGGAKLTKAGGQGYLHLSLQLCNYLLRKKWGRVRPPGGVGPARTTCLSFLRFLLCCS